MVATWPHVQLFSWRRGSACHSLVVDNFIEKEKNFRLLVLGTNDKRRKKMPKKEEERKRRRMAKKEL